VVDVELQGQLLAQERELDSREGTITAWRMDWQLLSAPLERCTWNMMSVTSELRLSNMTSLPRHAPLVPGPHGSPTSTGHWRNARSSFAYRIRILRCKRQYWRRSRRASCIPPTSGTYQRNWKRPACMDGINGERAVEAGRLS
jgi:hypothetical protein